MHATLVTIILQWFIANQLIVWRTITTAARMIFHLMFKTFMVYFLQLRWILCVLFSIFLGYYSFVVFHLQTIMPCTNSLPQPEQKFGLLTFQLRWFLHMCSPSYLQKPKDQVLEAPTHTLMELKMPNIYSSSIENIWHT